VDALGQGLHPVTRHERAGGVHLQDESLGAVGLGPRDGVLDAVGDRGVDEAAHLEHIYRWRGGTGRLRARRRRGEGEDHPEHDERRR